MNVLTATHVNDGFLSLWRDNRENKFKLISTFLRIGIKSVLFPSTTKEKFLGYKINTFDYRSFAMVFLEIFLKQEYRLELKEKPVIFDCGANIGTTTLFFKWVYPDATIWAFEPLPENFEMLTKNIDQNHLKGITLSNTALANSNGKAKFYYSDPGNKINSLGASLYHNRGFGDKVVEVEKIRLANLLDGFKHVDLLKMDVEGAEWELVKDLCETGKISKIKNFVCEYHFDPDDAEHPLDEFLLWFRKAGFEYDVYLNKGVSNIVIARRPE